MVRDRARGVRRCWSRSCRRAGSARCRREPEVVMQISLGGAVGPRDGGLATLARTPDAGSQPRAEKAIEPVRAARRQGARDGGADEDGAEEADSDGQGRGQGSRGAARRRRARRSSRATPSPRPPASGQGFGLSAGGGGTGGYLDVANFCCPDYLATMIDLINRNWNSKQGARGTTLLKFDIERDGRITNIVVERSSGVPGARLLLAAVAGAHPAVPAAARRVTRASG